MRDVPHDILAAAEAMVADMCKLHEYAARPAWVNVAAKALMAERERCAQISIDMCSHRLPAWADDIAAAIRAAPPDRNKL